MTTDITKLDKGKMYILIEGEAPSLYCSVANPSGGKNSYYDQLKMIAGNYIEVETDYLFENQFNTVPIPNVSSLGMRIREFHVERVINDARIGKAKCSYCGTTSTNLTKCGKCEQTTHLKMFKRKRQIFEYRGYDASGQPVKQGE